MSKAGFTSVESYQLGTDNYVPVAAIKTLDRDGVVCIRKAFSSDWLDVIESGIDMALNGASTDIDIVKRKNDAGSFSVSSGAWRQVDPFRRFIFESHIGDIAQTLLDTRQLILLYDFLLIKEAMSNHAATPWHQDHSYYPLDGKKVINCWIALDDIPIESSLRFIQASHQPGRLYRAVDFENPRSEYRHARNELPLPPTIDSCLSSEMLSTATQIGDMLIWTSYTLHSAPGNQLNQRRAAFSVNWVGDDVVFNGEASLETYRAPELVVGQSIVCDKFPVVRHR